jgi:hypothetical protein
LGGIALSTVALLGLAERSFAAQVTWDLSTGASATARGCNNAANPANDCSASTGTVGNIRTFTNGTNILKAAAFSTTDDAGTSDFVKAWLGIYSSGLGVTNSGEMSNPGSPNHTVDNNGKNDLIVFQFSTEGWTPLTTLLKQFGDTDITAWVGGNNITDLTSPTWTSIGTGDLTAANGWTKYTQSVSGGQGAQLTGTNSDRTANLNVDPSGATPALNLTGKFLIIAAEISHSDDAFKIKTLKGETPSTAVPEPVTSALFGVGLVALGLIKRRTR